MAEGVGAFRDGATPGIRRQRHWHHGSYAPPRPSTCSSRPSGAPATDSGTPTTIDSGYYSRTASNGILPSPHESAAANRAWSRKARLADPETASLRATSVEFQRQSAIHGWPGQEHVAVYGCPSQSCHRGYSQAGAEGLIIATAGRTSCSQTSSITSSELTPTAIAPLSPSSTPRLMRASIALSSPLPPRVGDGSRRRRPDRTGGCNGRGLAGDGLLPRALAA